MKQEDISLWGRKVSVIKKYPHFDSCYFNTNIIQKKLLDNNYCHQFLPLIDFNLKKIKWNKEISKRKKVIHESRCISLCSHKDRSVYIWFNIYLSIYYERALRLHQISDNVIAYRSLRKNNVNFANEVFKSISNNKSRLVIYCVDVENFFGSIDHTILKKKLNELLKTETLPKNIYSLYRSVINHKSINYSSIEKMYQLNSKEGHEKLIKNNFKIDNFKDFKNLLKSGALQYNKKEKKNIGIPQGIPISPFLANLYMLEFDKNVSHYINNLGGIYRRYSDDIIVSFDIKYEDSFVDFLKNQFELIRLNISKEKTQIFYWNGKNIINKKNNEIDFIDYLGIRWNGEKFYLRTKSLSKNYAKMICSVKKWKAISKFNK